MRKAEYRRAQRQGGFSLIEVVITLVVLSVAVVGVLSVFSTGIKESADPIVLNQAVQLAQEKLDIIIGDRMNANRGFAYIASANYPVENPVAGFAGFTRTVATDCVTSADLNTPAGAPPCASGYTHVTVTVAHTVIGSVSVDTVVTDY